MRVGSRTEAIHLYHIAQEALHNACKHAGATEVVVRLEQEPLPEANERTVKLTVRDDGRGLQQDVSAAVGMGQRIMRYRANLIGAQFQIESQPRQGTTVTCRLQQRARQKPATNERENG